MNFLSKPAVYFALVLLVTVANAHGADLDVIQELNCRRDPLVPGAIYVLENGKLVPILELLKEVPLYELGAWINRQELEVESVKIASYQRPYCYCRRWYWSVESIQVTGGQRRVERIGDSFGCLEILNRPGTGLIYNRESEIRMNQWRETVFEHMRRAARARSAKIVLCTETIAAVRPSLLVSEASDSQQAMSASRSAIDTLGLKCGEAKKTTRGVEIPLEVEQILLEARFRELTSVLTSTQPQLQFAYADEVVLGNGGAVSRLASISGKKIESNR